MIEDNSGGEPRHLNPAGEITSIVESGEVEIELVDHQGEAELRAFLNHAKAGRFEASPELEATVRIVRSLLEEETDSK